MSENKTANVIPAVSVIVPVCNVEDYLEQCIESLSKQTLKNIEFILVDDGSKDSCPQILAKAAGRDSRMRVITKPNGGYGSGINRGLKEARGEYIGIVEPDDWIDSHMYEDLYNAAALEGGKKADIVKSAYWEYYDLPGETPYMLRPNLMNCMPKRTFVSTVKDDFELLFHHPSIWSGIYRKEFIEEHKIRMMEVPGGGWVDNPFFFETFLQAENYVWIPAAYYYYRQTNPNSSSNLKNYHLPYDRLRDLRALFARLNVTDPQIWACLYARHFYYTYSVIGEWGFFENDPELKNLIYEAISAVNPKILYGGYRGLHREYITFYESIVKDPAENIPSRRNEVKSPRISVIVPAFDDRHGLSETLTDLALQSVSDIEVICVDCGSNDPSMYIAESFAKKDCRFKAVSVKESGYAAGIKKGLELAKAPVSALIFAGCAVYKNYLKDILAVTGKDTDICISLAVKKRTFCSWDEDQTVAVSGNEPQVLLCAIENTSCCAFKTDFIKNSGIQISREDSNGYILLLEVISKARKAALRFGEKPVCGAAPRRSAREADYTETDRYKEYKRILDAAYEISKSIGPQAEAAFRAMAVRRLLDCARVYMFSREGEEILKDIQNTFKNEFGLLQAPRSSYCNIDAFLALEQLVNASYQDSLCTEARIANAAGRRIKAKNESYRNTKMYKMARSLYHGLLKVKRGVSAGR